MLKILHHLVVMLWLKSPDSRSEDVQICSSKAVDEFVDNIRFTISNAQWQSLGIRNEMNLHTNSWLLHLAEITYLHREWIMWNFVQFSDKWFEFMQIPTNTTTFKSSQCYELKVKLMTWICTSLEEWLSTDVISRKFTVCSS